MPKLTMAATDATFMEWLVEDGEIVEQDQPLYTVETDKVETEVPSPATGVLRYGAVREGEVYPVGTELALIEVTS
ncbi:MAG: biotin-requiring enzyme family protein [Actinomycetota bacterium]|nr:biotin-requiring enzyme family protein [Actinomycetota bacterium]